MNNEVLIVGSGPTGLTAAVMLALHKIPVRIIEKKIEPTKTSNALGIHIRTLEVFKMMGIIDEFLARGEKVKGLDIFSEDKLLIRLSFSQVKNTEFNYALALPQSETEAILAAYLERFGVQVERGIELEDISQTEALASVTLKHNQTNQREEKQYPWVLACDGAHSVVREKLNMPFIGTKEDNQFIMMDCKLKWDQPHDVGVAFFSELGPVATIGLGKRYSRVIVDVSQDEQLKNKKDPEIQDFKRVLSERHIPYQFEDVQWISRFSIKHCHVESFQQGRVFYLGDSAHVHSPVGGQGMNTGIQDANNLAWKLAFVCKEQAPASLLKTYNQERLPNAKRLLKGTQFATEIVTTKIKWRQRLRNLALSTINKVDFVKNKIVRQIAELDITYQSDLMTPSNYKEVKAGMRMPDFPCQHDAGKFLYDVLNPCRYTLLYKNIDVTGLEHEGLRCIEIDKEINFDKNTCLSNVKEPLAILIRPDQYVAVVAKDRSSISHLPIQKIV